MRVWHQIKWICRLNESKQAVDGASLPFIDEIVSVKNAQNGFKMYSVNFKISVFGISSDKLDHLWESMPFTLLDAF